ncbi:feruloyl-CoA synthase [Amycolatopsis nigrescens]|uniref:feruloyl-CoA synthase n=1 Tax=Amycolatopsis nigrescens TaxID=381445 RepID=UPI0007C4C1D3|nr:feruloyl-CoA synthase [Amycolatopsis nigrescens]
MPPIPAELFAPPRVELRRRGDGTLLLGSRDELGPHPVSVAAMLRERAAADPGHPLVAQRGPDGQWMRYGYGESVATADAIGQALLDRGLGPDRPLLVLSGNSVEHLLITLGALTVGVPVIPVSVAYSLLTEHTRVTEIAALVRPGAVFADDGARFGAVLRALRDVPAIVSVNAEPALHATLFGDLASTAVRADVERAFQRITPDSVAKILFTSGSTGSPKGVLNTHRMLCSNQRSIRQAWPFLAERRPVVADWLPWSHTFGGNHNVNLVLANGGTLYIDGGRPTPDGIALTIANVADVRPTVYFSVPAGWARLVPELERDQEFAERFFSRLDLMVNAAAALPAELRRRLDALAWRTTGRRIPVTGAWGATETAPAVTMAHYEFTDARCIGVPLPGAEVKLVPDEDAYEIRVRGPMVTPGYLRAPELTAAAFDEEGFYRSGDAVDLADPADPAAGLLFRSRISEDFKLTTGTFVRVAALRTALLSGAPVLSDAVIVGEHRCRVCALAWLDRTETEALFGADPLTPGEVVEHEELAVYLGARLRELNRGAGSAGRIERLILLGRPPELNAGEITDKGYVNQRRVLARRAAQVEQLYLDVLPPHVILPAR